MQNRWGPSMRWTPSDKYKQESQLKVIVFLIIIVVNFFCLWFLFSFIGIENIQPIGFTDSFGYVLPPKWVFLVTVFIALIEFVALTTLFPLEKKGKLRY